MTEPANKPRPKGPRPGEFDSAGFAQYPIFAHLGALIVCFTMLPGLVEAGDVIPLEKLKATALMFGAGLGAALWAGFAGKLLKLPTSGFWAGLNFIVPILVSAVLLFAGALYGLALLSASFG